MFKMMVLIKRKPGITRQEFIDYYESNHAPLIERLGVAPPVYRRNYIDADDPFMALIGADRQASQSAGFDVITESVFGTRDEAEEALKRFADPRVQEAIVEDEDRFLDRSSVRFFIVEAYGCL